MADTGVTPMMAQYLDIKAGHPDALLFYRMGDFYEMFFDDAVAAAAALDIALTKRGRHLDADIPMCGVPVASSDGYLMTLIRKGFRVAIAEQIEDPAAAKRRGAKSVVARAVTRVVTPGTLTEDALLDARRPNWLAAFAVVRGEGALAWADVSTGVLRTGPCAPAELGRELARLAPREVLLAEGGAYRDAVVQSGAAPTEPARATFDTASARKRLCALWGLSSLDAYGAFGHAELAAMGALAAYVELTQAGRAPHLLPPVRELPAGRMRIDAATRASLEITTSLSGARSGSLLDAIDRTRTGPGGRLLAERLGSPSCELTVIERRLAAVAFLRGESRILHDVRTELGHVPDVDRALGRLSLDRGGPRDLGAVRTALACAATISGWLGAVLPPLLAEARHALVGLTALAEMLDAALGGDLPVLARDGGFIAPGHDAALDAARTLRDESRTVIASLQARYARLAGVTSLKVRHNNVLGYFVETTATHAEKMRALPETFVHRQTTAGQVRFATAELADLETRILDAGAEALAIELQHFAELRAQVLARRVELTRMARALAEIDVAAGFAEVARSGAWTEPEVDDGRAFDIEGGRHPVVESALRRVGGTGYVANDCHLSPGDGAAIRLLTGPNMAGKSTYLRQNALIALLAQAGAFVPAEHAHIGIVSQIFSRVGAADDLARGRSTFMVEMIETAAILHQADDRAFVILDEIGRGTATYDGLSIAWATLEHLHDVNRCRGLFATHYHELTGLAGRLDGVTNATMAVKEFRGDVVFLHEVRDGAADRSYGIQVARLAGLPLPVVARAKAVLATLERTNGRTLAMPADLPLFAAAPPPARSEPKALSMLQDADPDALTPKAALELVYALKATLSG